MWAVFIEDGSAFAITFPGDGAVQTGFGKNDGVASRCCNPIYKFWYPSSNATATRPLKNLPLL